jgi:tetratricopeptide (TPR) repeat protein
MRHAREISTIEEPSTSPVRQAFSATNMGSALILAGEAERAAELLREGLATTRQFRIGLFAEAVNLARLSEALRQMGKAEEALATAREAVAVARRQGAVVWVVEGLLAVVRALRVREEIAAALDEAGALVEESGARAYEPFVRVERAALAGMRGEEVVRERELREAKRLFVTMGATLRAKEVGDGSR